MYNMYNISINNDVFVINITSQQTITLYTHHIHSVYTILIIHNAYIM